MKAILASATIATIFFSFPVTALAAYPTVKISDSFYVDNSIKTVSVKKDERVEILKAYLETHKSPMVGNAKDFVEAADQYDLDWKLVASIAGVESTFGKHTPGGAATETFNAWGWGVYGNQALGFGSFKNGIYTVSRGLRENYVNKGYDTPEKMNRKYASSKTWGMKVNFFLGKIGTFESNFKSNNQNVAVEEKQFDVQTAGESAQPYKSMPLSTTS